jgi:hypothetical protein
MKTINAQDVKWVKKSGYGIAQHLFGSWQIPSTFQVFSPKSNTTKTFGLDANSPGYEDGWDGEFKMFISDCGEIRITVSYDE